MCTMMAITYIAEITQQFSFCGLFGQIWGMKITPAYAVSVYRIRIFLSY